MTWLEQRLLLISRAAAIIGVLMLLAVAGLSVIDIVTREATGQPIRGAGDLAAMLTIVIIASCFPAGLLERRQIKVTLLGALLPGWANRALEVFGAILTLLMFIAIAWFLTRHAIRLSGRGDYTMVLQMPIAPWWWAAVVCFWICIPAQIFVTLAEILGRPTPDHEA